MEAGLVVRGAVLGLAVAAPVGPIGVLVIRRSVEGGAWLGLATGMGAAVADASYAAVAALGLGLGASAWSSSLPFRAVSAAILVWLAVRAVRARPAPATEVAPVELSSLGRAFASTVALTLANPATIVSFAAASTAIGVSRSAGIASAVLFAASVLAGSSAWWIALSVGSSSLRATLGPRSRRAIDLASGFLLFAFALFSLLRPASRS
jgi:putative LysE/RhtB family amino acid efflux pump